MARWFWILWARVRCHAYLIVKGTWRGELEMVCRDDSSRVTLVATVRGSLFDEGDPIEVLRVFFCEDD